MGGNSYLVVEMKKLLMGLVIAFISIAVLVVSGCSQNDENLEIIECDPERKTKQIYDFANKYGKDVISAPITLSSAGSSSSTWSFAHHSGTSGCGNYEESPAYIQQQEEFVLVNLDNLSEDIAQGGGPHLQSLSALLGCPTSDYPALADLARRNFGRLFPTTETTPAYLGTSATTFLDRLNDAISRDPRLSESCTHLEERPPDEDHILSGTEPGGSAVVGRAKQKQDVIRLALFTSLSVGNCGKGPDEGRVLKAFRQVLSRNPWMDMVYSVYRDVPGSKILQNDIQREIDENTWEGVFKQTPKTNFIRNMGRRLQVDGVIVFLYDNICGTGDNNAITIYAFAMGRGLHNRKKYYVFGHERLVHSIQHFSINFVRKMEPSTRTAVALSRPAAPSGPRAGTPAVQPPALREGKGARLAIFPELVLGDAADESEITSRLLVKRIVRRVTQFPGIFVAYSYLDRPKEEHADLRATVWRIGNFFASPKLDGVRSRAKALGADVAMQVLIRVNPDDAITSTSYSVTYEVHLLEVNRPRHHYSKGFMDQVGLALLRAVESSVGEVIEKYKRTTRSR